MLLKNSLLMLATLAIAGQAASVTTEDQSSSFSKVKETKTVISKEIINEVTYMPPMMVVGNNNGSITRCPISTPNSCEVYHSGNNENSNVTATVVHGEFLYASLDTGIMLRCTWQKRHSCYEFNQAEIGIVGLAVAMGYIHAGLRNGTIMRCQLDTPGNCWNFADVRREITSLAAIGSFIYAGSYGGRVDRCSLDSEQTCKGFYEIIGGTQVNGIVSLDGRIYALRLGGFIQSSDMEANHRSEWEIRLVGYTSIATYNRRLYVARSDKGVYMNDPGSRIPELVLENVNAVSISFAYGTFAMQDKYRLESQKCIWQGIFTCPPTVVYYDVRSRAQWEVSVKDGRLYDSQGVLLDTSDADESYSEKAAIFVMGPDGQILVSKFHKRGHTHTSSLLAGNPVSGAGLMVVEGGKIKNITACSIHYRPDQALNDQVKESLNIKGYTDNIDTYPCKYNVVLCAIDENDINDNTTYISQTSVV